MPQGEEGAMTKIICDAALREKLHDLVQPLELCDESGHILARVLPVGDSRLDVLEPQISKEERQRRRSYEGGTYTTSEVLAYLESLQCFEWNGYLML
jgi:hypothetical protein